MAEKYKCNGYSDIKIFHNTDLLNNDETSTDCILNGDYIKIEEDLNIDSYFYQSLFSKYKKSKKIQVDCEIDDKKIFRTFPEDITFKELKDALLTIKEISTKYRDNFYMLLNSFIIDEKKNIERF